MDERAAHRRAGRRHQALHEVMADVCRTHPAAFVSLVQVEDTMRSYGTPGDVIRRLLLAALEPERG